jgi:hypothetical protein
MLRRPAETVDETVHGGEQFDPTDVVPLSALAAEGFGWDGPFVANPRAAVAALAVRFAGEVVLDDLGRRCVSRPTARGLFAEREGGERRQREALSWPSKRRGIRSGPASRPVGFPTASRRLPR